jgi:hypothetical protein
MSDPKRTPGPWKTVDYLARAEEIHGPDGQILAMRQDDAKLGDMLAMAAAPELLEALRVLLECREYGALQPNADAWDMASAAIAKATGSAA